MLLSLKRDSTVREFLRQKFPDSVNNFLSWVIISVVFCVLFAAFISPFIPIVPEKVQAFSFFGFELTKFGFALATISVLTLLRCLFSYLFYAGTGSLKKWEIFYFTASKFYFCASVGLMILCVINFYFTVNPFKAFGIYTSLFFLLFIFKLLFYLLHANNVLPAKWYYKFLYICTLQIVPLIVLWRVLFFENFNDDN